MISAKQSRGDVRSRCSKTHLIVRSTFSFGKFPKNLPTTIRQISFWREAQSNWKQTNQQRKTNKMNEKSKTARNFSFAKFHGNRFRRWKSFELENAVVLQNRSRIVRVIALFTRGLSKRGDLFTSLFCLSNRRFCGLFFNSFDSVESFTSWLFGFNRFPSFFQIENNQKPRTVFNLERKIW